MIRGNVREVGNVIFTEVMVPVCLASVSDDKEPGWDILTRNMKRRASKRS